MNLSFFFGAHEEDEVFEGVDGFRELEVALAEKVDGVGVVVLLAEFGQEALVVFVRFDADFGVGFENVEIIVVEFQFGLKVVAVHGSELEAVEGGDVGEVVVEVGFDLIVLQGEFGVLFADVEIGKEARNDDVREDSLQLGAFP